MKKIELNVPDECAVIHIVMALEHDTYHRLGFATIEEPKDSALYTLEDANVSPIFIKPDDPSADGA